jgi:hypothetical protein
VLWHFLVEKWAKKIQNFFIEKNGGQPLKGL